MIFLTTCWAIGYGWFEADIGIGFLLGIPGAVNGKVQWYSFLGGLYSSYHLFLRFHDFLHHVWNWVPEVQPHALLSEAVLTLHVLGQLSLGFDGPGLFVLLLHSHLQRRQLFPEYHAWTCGGLNLGCVTLANPGNLIFRSSSHDGTASPYSFHAFSSSWRTGLPW